MRTLPRPLARLAVRGMGAVRFTEGLVEVASPATVMRLFGAAPIGPGTALGIRMKGGRDVAVGVMTGSAWHDDRALAVVAVASAICDAGDGLAVALDRGRTIPPRGDRLASGLGFVAAAGLLWAGRSLADR